MPDYILALDQGTTSSRAIVFDKKGGITSVAQKEFAQIYPAPGWVEHDPMEIWTSQVTVATEAIIKGGLTPSDIAAIGITNQRETTVVWDRDTGKPVCNAIVWQDRRTASFCDTLREKGHDDEIREKTGLILDAYFSATKIHQRCLPLFPQREPLTHHKGLRSLLTPIQLLTLVKAFPFLPLL